LNSFVTDAMVASLLNLSDTTFGLAG